MRMTESQLRKDELSRRVLDKIRDLQQQKDEMAQATGYQQTVKESYIASFTGQLVILKVVLQWMDEIL